MKNKEETEASINLHLEKMEEPDELTVMNKGHIIGCPCFFCIRNSVWKFTGKAYRTDHSKKVSFEGGVFRPSNRKDIHQNKNNELSSFFIKTNEAEKKS